MKGRWVIIQADDLGSSPSISQGILAAHDLGAVTQTSVIVPAPGSGPAIAAAMDAGLPLGVHLTLMCEWETQRWKPLTDAPSLCGADGAFWPGTAEARRTSVRSEIVSELHAQVSRARNSGAAITHLDSHIGIVDPEALSILAARLALPCRDPIPPPGKTLPLDSLWHLSLIDYRSKVDRLVEHLTSLPDGIHMIVCHPAVDGPDLYELCSLSSRRWKWAVDIRLSDLDALTHPRFLQTCEEQKINLVSVADIAAISQQSKGPDHHAINVRPIGHDTVEIDAVNT